MPKYDSKFNCLIPRDYAARRRCYELGQQFGEASIDAHSAAVKQVNYMAKNMQFDPSKDPMDRNSMASKVKEIETEIQKELDKEWAQAKKEFDEREKFYKEKGEEAIRERLRYEGEAIARANPVS